MDLFAEASARINFPEAVDAVIAAYQRDGLETRVEAPSLSLARLSVGSGGEQARVELGMDWQVRRPRSAGEAPPRHSGRPPQLVPRRFRRDAIEQGEQPLRQVDGTTEVDISQGGMTARLDSAGDGLIESG